MTTGALTIQDNDTLDQYTAVGESTFVFNFPILENDELKVSRNQVLLTFGVDYSITGLGDDGGGYITLLGGPSTPGDIWTLWQDMPIERLTGFSAGAATILGAALNAEFAARLRVEQQLRREIRNCLHVPADDPISGQDLALDQKSVRAGKFLAWDAQGNPTSSAGTGNDSALRTDLANPAIGSDLVALKRTPAEITAGVVPSNYLFLEGEGARYGVLGTGAGDDRAAILRAYAVWKAGGPRPRIRGTCRVLKDGANDYSLLLDSHADFEDLSLIGDGVNNYALVYVNGGANVRVRFKRCRFDGAKAVLTRAAPTNDIGLRFGSSIDWAEVDDCDFTRFNEDGVYFNVSVTGAGAAVHHCRFSSIYRAAGTIVAGQRIKFHHNTAIGILLQPFQVNPPNNATLLRDCDVDDNLIVGGGTANGANDVIDRAGIYLGGKTGATVANQQNLNARRNRIINYAAGYAGAMLALGIETREITDTHVAQNFVTGCTTVAGNGWALYSYLTTRAVYEGNTATLSNIGLRMNACTLYSDIGNTCQGNLTNEKNYNGPDGPTSFLRADGLNEVIAYASISIPAGVPTLNESFNITSLTDLGVGDTRFNLTRNAGSANYRVQVTPRSSAGNVFSHESASHLVASFRVVTFSGTWGGAYAAADDTYDVEVRGCALGTVPP